MTGTEQTRRSLELTLQEAVPNKHMDKLKKAFAQIDAVVESSFSDKNINIEYLFPMTSYHEIWSVLKQLLGANRFSYSQRLINSFRAYLEENEQAHLTRQFAWDAYIRNVYITYFAPDAREAGVRKPGYIFPSSRFKQLKGNS